MAGCLRARCRVQGGAIGMVGQQQDVAALEAGLAQQSLRPRNRAIGALAVLRHDVRLQCVKEQRHVGRVLGQGRHGVRIVRIGDKGDLPASTLAQQGRDLRARLGQPRGLQVARQRGAGQVQRDHQWRAGLPQRVFLLAHAGTRQCQHGQDRRQQAQPARQRATRRGFAGVEQVRQQVRIHSVAPSAAPARARLPPPCDQRQRQQAKQPAGPQEMQLGEVREEAHARLRTTSASKPNANAAPNGSG